MMLLAFISRSASHSQANRKTIARTWLADHLRPPRLLLPARAELAHPVRLPLAPPKLALFAHPSLALRLSAQFNPHSWRRSPSLAQLTFSAPARLPRPLSLPTAGDARRCAKSALHYRTLQTMVIAGGKGQQRVFGTRVATEVHRALLP